MTISLKPVDKSVSGLAQFRAQQDAVAIGLCSQLGTVYWTQHSDAELNIRLRDWGIFAADLLRDGRLRMAQEPPRWLRASPEWKRDEDFTLSRRHGNETEVKDHLDPPPTMGFFEDAEGFKRLLVQAHWEVSSAVRGGTLLMGSSVNPSAPLFSKREPYHFGDIDVVMRYHDPHGEQEHFPSPQFLAGGRRVYEIFNDQQKLRVKRADGRLTTQSVKVEVHRRPMRSPDYSSITENTTSCAFSISEHGQLVPHQSDQKGGRWRISGQSKYYRYLSEKFMGWMVS